METEMRNIIFQFDQQTQILTQVHRQIYRHLYHDGVIRSIAGEELQQEIE